MGETLNVEQGSVADHRVAPQGQLLERGVKVQLGIRGCRCRVLRGSATKFGGGDVFDNPAQAVQYVCAALVAAAFVHVGEGHRRSHCLQRWRVLPCGQPFGAARYEPPKVPTTPDDHGCAAAQAIMSTPSLVSLTFGSNSPSEP